MWLVSCRRQGMLTQGPRPDPKCKLNMWSFLTLPHLLDYLICTRNSMSIVLLLWMMGWGGGWHRLGRGGGGWFISGCGWETEVGYCLIVCSFFFLLLLLPFVLSCPVLCFKWIEHDSCCVCFFVYYLFSLSPVPLGKTYWGIELFCLSCKTIKPVSDHYSVE